MTHFACILLANDNSSYIDLLLKNDLVTSDSNLYEAYNYKIIMNYSQLHMFIVAITYAPANRGNYERNVDYFSGQ